LKIKAVVDGLIFREEAVGESLYIRLYKFTFGKDANNIRMSTLQANEGYKFFLIELRWYRDYFVLRKLFLRIFLFSNEEGEQKKWQLILKKC
jgi:hypothetical protein